MTDQAARQTVFATLRCGDAGAMTEFLTKAFGFTEVVAYRDDSGAVVHAQLAYGPTSLMLGQAGDSDFDRLVEGNGANALYVVVDDPHAHCATAEAAGAEIVEKPHEQEYGSLDYLARDPEGNLWTFGTYGGAQGVSPKA